MAVTVLLTPVGLDKGCWQWIHLPESEIVAYEFPGHGTRPWSSELLSLEALADDVLHAVPDGSELHLVGVSFGGMVAQHVALRHGDRVASMVLACTCAATQREALLARADVADAGEDVDITLERWFTSKALASEPELPGVIYARRRLETMSRRAMADSWRTMAGHDVREHRSPTTIPVTCVAGRRDLSTPPGVVEELCGMWQNGRLVTVDEPHMFLLESPDKLSNVLGQHFAELEL